MTTDIKERQAIRRSSNVPAYSQLADILEQAGNKGLFPVGAGQLFGDHLSRCRFGQAPIPEALIVKVGVVAALHGKEGKREHQAADRVGAENRHRMIDGGDLPRKTVEGGISDPEHLG